MSQLAMITKRFIIITPSKKIKIIHPLWNIIKEIREDKVTIIILDIIYNVNTVECQTNASEKYFTIHKN
jgi:hypothetical protein